MNRSLLLAVSGILVLASPSCVIGPSVSKADKATAKSFSPPANKALIYVYRPYSFYSAALSKGVWVNQQKVGNNGPGTFIAIPASPGTYQIQASGMPLLGLDLCNQEKAPLTMSVRANRNYFIRQNLTSYSSGQTMVPAGGVIVAAPNDVVIYVAEPVDEATGRAEVSKCRQVGTHVRF